MKKLIHLWCALCVMILCSKAWALDQETLVQVKGKDEYKIKAEGSLLRVKEGALDGATLEKTASGVWVLKRGKDTLASLEPKAAGAFELRTTTTEVQFKGKEESETLRVFSNADALVTRLKLKDDKFNVYDPEGKRVYHGSEKDDGYGIKDEKGEQVWKLKGVKSLKEAGPFGLLLPVEHKVLIWAYWFAPAK